MTKLNIEEIRLPHSEIKVMDILWEKGEISAKDVALLMDERYSWKKNTTYTVLKNLKDKGVMSRRDPGFICTPLVERAQIGKVETQNLLNRFYHGSATAAFSAFIGDKAISKEELDEIRTLLDRKQGME